MNSPIHRVAQPAVVPEMVCEIKILVPKGKTGDPVVLAKGVIDKAFLTGVLELAKLKVMTQKDTAAEPGIEVPTPEAQKAILQTG